jgi:hypothetical protein
LDAQYKIQVDNANHPLEATERSKLPAQDQTGATTIHHKFKGQNETQHNNKSEGNHTHNSNKVKIVARNVFAAKYAGTHE